MKKIIVPLLLFMLLLGAVVFYFKNNQSKSQETYLFEAIPANFPIAVESHNWSNLLTKIDTFSYGSNLKQREFIQLIESQIEYVTTLNEATNVAGKILGFQHALFAFGNGGNGQLTVLTAIPANTISSSDLKAILKQQNYSFQLRNFENFEIITLNNLNNKETQFCFFANKVLYLASKESAIEEAIMALNVKENEMFNEFAKTFNTEQDATVYIKPKKLTFLSNYFFKSGFTDFLQAFENICGPFACQLSFFEKELVLNGIAPASSQGFLDSLKIDQASENTLISVLPQNTALVQAYSTNQLGLMETDNFRVKNFLLAIDKQYALYTLESFDANLSKRKGLVVKGDFENIKTILSDLDSMPTIANKLNDVEILYNRAGELLNTCFFTKSFTKDVYYASIDDVVFFSSEQNVVEQSIESYVAKNTLQSKKTYNDFVASISGTSNATLFMDVPLCMPFLVEAANNVESVDNIGKMALQFSKSGNDYVVLGKVAMEKSTKEKSALLWTCALDAPSHYKPQMVYNYELSEYEILTQDDKNQIYLIDKSGTILWKLQLDEAIISDVYQIDYYGNTKYQFVFNTKNNIYVMDRNGNHVDGFPIKLPAEATNGLLVVNYDNAGIYRFFVACANENMYGFENNGTPLPGWNPLKNVGVVKNNIQHAVYEGKDYLFFNNTKGQFIAVNRKGEKRFNLLNTNCSKTFLFNKGFWFAGWNGKYLEIDTKGTLKTKDIVGESYTVFDKIYSGIQGTDAYAFAGGNSFLLQANSSKNLASFKTDGTINKIESFAVDGKVWFLLYAANKVYLIDELGALYPNFPIESASEVRAFNFIKGKNRILLYNDLSGNLKAFQINWSN